MPYVFNVADILGYRSVFRGVAGSSRDAYFGMAMAARPVGSSSSHLLMLLLCMYRVLSLCLCQQS